MNKNKEIKVTYESDYYGNLRLYYNPEMEELLFCAKDAAKRFGFSDPGRSVRAHCMHPKKVEFETNGGPQRLNFIDENDLLRLSDHAPYPDADDVLEYIDEIVNDFYADLDDERFADPVPAKNPLVMDPETRALYGKAFLEKFTEVIEAIELLSETMESVSKRPELLLKTAFLLHTYNQAHAEA